MSNVGKGISWSAGYWHDQLGMADELEGELGRQKELEEEALKSTALSTYSFKAGEVEQLAKLDLNFFAALAIPQVFEVDYPPTIQAIWELLLDMLGQINKSPKVALGIPRGHAKTTLIKLFVLYVVLYTDIKFILIIGSTQDNAFNIIADVEDMLSEKNIVSTFGDWSVGTETDTKGLKKFGYRGRNIVIAGLGAGGSIRGINIKNTRPDLMIFEDVQSKECAESDIASSSLERWMIGTAMKARDPRGCLYVFVGNMYPGPNSILRKLKNNPTWIKFISGAILADGTALFPALRSYESLVEELNNDISMGHPEIFFSEVMNDVEVGINSNTDLALIRSWPWADYDVPQGKFIIIDPSSNRKGGDLVGIGYFEVYDATPGLRKVIEEALSPGNTIRRALLLAIQTRTRLIAVESTAYQFSLLYWFNEIATQLGISGISFVEVYSGSYSKNSRIQDTLKELTQGEVDLHNEVRSKVLQQIVNWNPLKRDNVDNILDLLAYAKRVMELYGADIASDIEGVVVDSETGSARVRDYNSAF